MECTYQFEIEARPQDERELDFDDLGVEDGVWTCPHETDAEHDYCVFHRPPMPGTGDGPDRVDRLLDIVNDPGTSDRRERKRARQFVGAVFDAVTLRDLHLSGPDVAKLDLRHSEVHGNLRIERTTSDHPVDLSGATVYGETTVTGATFRRGLRARGTAFKADAHVARTDITGEADLSGAIFEGDAIFDETEFDIGPNFARVSTQGTLRFDGSGFGGRQSANFYRCTVDDGLVFRKVTAESDLRLERITLGGDLVFDRARVSAAVELGIQEPQIDPSTAVQAFVFDNARIERVDLRLEETTVDQYLSFADATISAGKIGFPADGTAVVDLRDATVGDVRFTPTAGTAGGLDTAIDHVFFFRTDFEGFDFTDTSLQFERYPGSLHELPAGCREIIRGADGRKAAEPEAAATGDVELAPSADQVDYRDVIATYLKAKTGADTVGAARLAGLFYKREMDYRRERSVRRLRADIDDGVRSLDDAYRTLSTFGGALENRLLRTTTAYGESPIRVLSWMVAIIVLFALLFVALDVDTGLTVPVPFGEQLLFSAQSFIALFLGTVPGNVTGLVAVASTVEGFLGALFVALLVFTLGRRVHR